MYVQQALSKKDLRDFGLVTGGIFIILFGLLLPFLKSHPFPVWPWIVAVLLSIGALFLPNLLKPVYQIWMRIGHVLGWVNTRILLSIIFFVLITPMGLAMRILGKDPMARKFDKNLKSYRINSKISPSKKMEVPF